MSAEAPRHPRPVSRRALALYVICRAFAVGSTRLMFPGLVVGAELLPAHGPYILAPVHRSNVDWIVVARLTRRRLRYLVKEEVWKAQLLGRFIELLGAFPVRRQSADRESLHRAMLVLAAGEPLVMFPEGTRRVGPVVEDLREGAAYLALRSRVPIVPVGLAGTDRAMPRGAKVPRPARLTLVVGNPISPEEFLGAGAGDGERASRVARSATHAMTAALAQSLNEQMARALEIEARRLPRLASGRRGVGGASGRVSSGGATSALDEQKES